VAEYIVDGFREVCGELSRFEETAAADATANGG
jgi:hypothetical protein